MGRSPGRVGALAHASFAVFFSPTLPISHSPTLGLFILLRSSGHPVIASFFFSPTLPLSPSPTLGLRLGFLDDAAIEVGFVVAGADEVDLAAWLEAGEEDLVEPVDELCSLRFAPGVFFVDDVVADDDVEVSADDGSVCSGGGEGCFFHDAAAADDEFGVVPAAVAQLAEEGGDGGAFEVVADFAEEDAGLVVGVGGDEDADVGLAEDLPDGECDACDG